MVCSGSSVRTGLETASSSGRASGHVEHHAQPLGAQVGRPASGAASVQVPASSRSPAVRLAWGRWHAMRMPPERPRQSGPCHGKSAHPGRRCGGNAERTVRTRCPSRHLCRRPTSGSVHERPGRHGLQCQAMTEKLPLPPGAGSASPKRQKIRAKTRRMDPGFTNRIEALTVKDAHPGDRRGEQPPPARGVRCCVRTPISSPS